MPDDVSELNRLRALADVRNAPGYRLILEEIDKLTAGAVSKIQSAGNDMEALAFAASELRAFAKCKCVIDTATEEAAGRVRKAFQHDPSLQLQSGRVGKESHS